MIKKRTAEILIVEDSPTQAEQLRYTLNNNGYLTSVAANGREALEIMGRSRPALVLSDIVMPEMDGIELCRMIKTDKRLKDVPVILLTALSEPSDVLKGLESGADNFITKPYAEKYLLEKIRHILLGEEKGNTSPQREGVEICFREEKYFITSERRRILDVLLSTYETALAKNEQLEQTREELEELNEALEERVAERTSALHAEILERRRAEEEISRLNSDLERLVAERTAQLEEANKDLESFNYSIAHDLNQPLRVISSFSAMVLEDNVDKLDADGKRFLNAIIDNARKLHDLIGDLLAFSRAGAKDLTFAELDMRELVESLLEELKPACEGRDVRFSVGDLPRAYGDCSAVRQIFSNLLRNAIKFTRKKQIAEIEIDAETNAGEPVYYVRDNGEGFDNTYRDKLFGVFQRLHPLEDFEGTGMGLAIVQRFVRKQGGRVWAEGAVGKGATFYFTLPAGNIRAE